MVIIYTKGLTACEVASRVTPFGSIEMEVFMVGDSNSAVWNVFRTTDSSTSIEPTDEEVAKFADEWDGRVIVAPFEETFRRLGAAGEAYTEEFRRQERMEDGSLHWAPVASTRPAGNAKQVVRYVPDYW